MTLQELSQLYWLNREVEKEHARLDELRRLAQAPTGSKLTGMPRAPRSADSKTERMVAEIVDLEAILCAKQLQCIHERARLERWINDIPDSQTRMIFRLRFVNGLTWDQVAYNVGGGNSPDSVKKRCYRYLRAEQDG